MRRTAAFAFLVLALLGPGPTTAQQQPSSNPAPLELGNVISPVLTIDRERVFLGSAFGKRVIAEEQARLENLAAENRTIEAELVNEEEALTIKRTQMDAEAFRVLADAFDKKVQETEQAQIAKQTALLETKEQEREAFWTAAAPVLGRVMQDSGAAVILDRRFVFYSVSAIDISNKTIALMDDTIGAGEKSE